MNFFGLSVISSFSISLAVLAGGIRFKKIIAEYRPFIILCTVALFNEGLSLVMVRLFKNNAVNSNIYEWVEFVLFCWQFRRWGALKNRSWHFPLLLGFMTALWIFDNLIWHRLLTLNSLFAIGYSFCLLFLSIEQINLMIGMARGSLLKNSRFLICAGILIYYSYEATIEVFYLLKLKLSDRFYDNVFFILALVNLFVNLIYALAILWAPKKQRFILPY